MNTTVTARARIVRMSLFRDIPSQLSTDLKSQASSTKRKDVETDQPRVARKPKGIGLKRTIRDVGGLELGRDKRVRACPPGAVDSGQKLNPAAFTRRPAGREAIKTEVMNAFNKFSDVYTLVDSKGCVLHCFWRH